MSITRKDVKHIANLARIEITEAEEAKFEKDLSGILTFIEKLSELETSHVRPMNGGTLEQNVMRDDKETKDGLQGKSADLIDNAPERKKNWVKVKAVFE